MPLSTLFSPVCLSMSLKYISQLLLFVTEWEKERILKFMEFQFCARYSLDTVSNISYNHHHQVGMMKELRLREIKSVAQVHTLRNGDPGILNSSLSNCTDFTLGLMMNND